MKAALHLLCSVWSCVLRAEAFNSVLKGSLLPATVSCQAGHRSLLIDSESFSGKLQLWPSDTGSRYTTASLTREPSIKLLYLSQLGPVLSQCVCFWETVCVWGLGSYLPWPQADCSPRAPGVSVRERWIGLSPLANLSPETPEPSRHPHLLQNILLEGVHRPLCPSSPLSPLRRGAIWGEERCDRAANLFLRVPLPCPCHSLPPLSEDGYLHGQGDTEFSLFPAACVDTDLDYQALWITGLA